MLDDETCARRVPTDAELTGLRSDLPHAHQHQHDGRVRERNDRLAYRELGTKVERRARARRQLSPTGRARTDPRVDEHQVAGPMVNDRRVLRCDTGLGQPNVAVRGATDDDALLAEPGDHSKTSDS